ncbi:MAG: hypothetical protein R6W78_16070 [Bacteroidales bacterium]
MICILLVHYLLIAPWFILPDNTYNNSDNNPGAWQPVKNSDGVKSYVRWTVTENETKTRERKGELVVEESIDQIVTILTDTKSATIWMKNVTESYDLLKVSDDEWYTYTLFNIPWPFENRDLVSHVKLKEYGNNNILSINMVSEENYIPLRSKTLRLTNYKAKWYLAAIDQHKTKITFSAITDSPPMFPRWIQDPVVESMFHNNLVSLKTYIVSNKKAKT